ncbi:hypothetical protein GS966_28625 [Rhodococcus hoagii]|nr:hypothetical protein [Prescottella equi]NKS10253.1 hypothetical protein [Prescottella equi]NKS35244.1 hypothetical protein [Prescottella equi]NKS62091.1 hypothetical protein [Prescottella equi]NKS68239.1 hypothetical protein [Prescottella equi]
MTHQHFLVARDGTLLSAATEVDLARSYAMLGAGNDWSSLERWERSNEIAVALRTIRRKARQTSTAPDQALART